MVVGVAVAAMTDNLVVVAGGPRVTVVVVRLLQ